MYFIIPESVRWLAQNNKEDEAMAALMKIAKVNGKQLKNEDKIQAPDHKKILVNMSISRLFRRQI